MRKKLNYKYNNNKKVCLLFVNVYYETFNNLKNIF